MTRNFSDWTERDVAEFNARQNPKRVFVPSNAVAVEKDLHVAIFDECRKRGWIALHGAMSERSHRTLGEPDFCVLADRGRVFFVEAKSRSGKLSPAQQALHAWAAKLGHTVHTIYTLEEFLKLV